MDFVHAKPVEVDLFDRLWKAMPVHNHHSLSHIVTHCHTLSQMAGGAEPSIHLGNSPGVHTKFTNIA